MASEKPCDICSGARQVKRFKSSGYDQPLTAVMAPCPGCTKPFKIPTSPLPYFAMAAPKGKQ